MCKMRAARGSRLQISSTSREPSCTFSAARRKEHHARTEKQRPVLILKFSLRVPFFFITILLLFLILVTINIIASVFVIIIIIFLLIVVKGEQPQMLTVRGLTSDCVCPLSLESETAQARMERESRPLAARASACGLPERRISRSQ